MGLSYDDFDALFPKVKREALHLEMREIGRRECVAVSIGRIESYRPIGV